MEWPEKLQARGSSWWSGWADLARRGEVDGYRDLPWLTRLRLDAACVGGALLRPGFWYAGLWCVAVALAGQVVAWSLDLEGWVRDGLQCLPVLLAAPWVARGRRRYLEQRCR